MGMELLVAFPPTPKGSRAEDDANKDDRANNKGRPIFQVLFIECLHQASFTGSFSWIFCHMRHFFFLAWLRLNCFMPLKTKDFWQHNLQCHGLGLVLLIWSDQPSTTGLYDSDHYWIVWKRDRGASGHGAWTPELQERASRGARDRRGKPDHTCLSWVQELLNSTESHLPGLSPFSLAQRSI